jgi:hypothetical protein
MLGVVFCAVVFSALLLHRYRSGLNYAPIHLDCGECSLDANKFRVLVQSPLGSIDSLPLDRRYQSRWCQQSSVAGIARILLVSSDAELTPCDSIRLRVGESWVNSREVKIISQRPIEPAADWDAVNAVELEVEPVSSRLSYAGKTINWQGDFYLLAVPFVQTVLLLALALVGVAFLRLTDSQNRSSVVVPQSSRSSRIFQFGRLVKSGVWLAAILFLCQHASSSFGELMDSRFGDQYLLAGMTLAIIVAAVWGFTLLVRSAHSDSAINRLAFGVIAFILVAKLIWVATVDSVQPMDYEQYWTYGKLMAAGDWDAIRQMSHPYKAAYVIRSFVYAFPVARVFGNSFQGMEVANVIVQVFTLLFFYLGGRKIVGPRAACAAIPFFAIYPDIWFASSLATHESPALLWMACSWWLFEKIRQRILRLRQITLSQFVELILLSTGFGVSASLVDLQRSYGPFVWAAIIVFFANLLSTWMDARTDDNGNAVKSGAGQKFSVGFGLAIFACVIAFSMSQQVRSRLSQSIGVESRSSTIGMLTAIESSRDSHLSNTLSWRLLYDPVIPAQERSEFFLRKLLWEKLGTGLPFWAFVARNNEILQDADFVMQFANCGMPGDSAAESWDILNWQMKRSICNGIYGLLCFLSILRLLLIKHYPLGEGEVFVVGFCVSGVSTILLLTEVLGPYDIFLAFPLAWNAGVLVSGAGISLDRASAFRETLSSFKWGVGCLAALLLVHAGLGGLVKAADISFPPFGDKEPSEVLADTSEVHSSPNMLSLSFREIDSRSISAGTVKATAVIPASVLRSGRVRFFVSGDQRVHRVFSAESDWNDFPITYSVAVGEEVVASGRLSELSVPRFVTHKFNDSMRNRDSVGVTMVLHCAKDLQIQSDQRWPVVAVEYLY